LRYGKNAGNMSGRHGNHAKGSRNARWNTKKLITSHGYILVRVDPSHPRAFGPPRLKSFKYAYEHDIIMERHIGRNLVKGEVVHHKNGKCDDNRIENLLLETFSDHAKKHVSVPGCRDKLGRFNSKKRIRL